MTRAAILISFFAILSSGCLSGELQPIEPASISDLLEGKLDDSETTCHVNVEDKKNALLRLPFTRAFSYYYKKEKGTANLAFLSAGAEVKKGDTVIQIFDYVKYKNTTINDKRSIFGVGYRVRIEYTVKSGKLDLGGIFSLGAKVSTGELSGSMVVEVMGITGELIDSLIPSAPLDLSETNMQSLFETMGQVKGKMYSNGVGICPSVLAQEDPERGLSIL